MAVLGGVTDVLDVGADNFRETLLQGLDHIAGLIDAERRLGDVGELVRIPDLKHLHVFGLDHQQHATENAAPGAFDFRVTLVADQNDLAVHLGVVLPFLVDLGHQRAGGVDDWQVALLGLVLDGFGNAVGAENRYRAVRHVVHLFDENSPLGPESLDHALVVDDFMAHVNRRTIEVDGLFDDFDGALHAGAKPARGGQPYVDFLVLFRCHDRYPITLPIARLAKGRQGSLLKIETIRPKVKGCLPFSEGFLNAKPVFECFFLAGRPVMTANKRNGR